MDLEQLSLIAEIVAAIAVVFSLLYLAIQIRHSRYQRKEEATNLVTQQRAEFINQMAQDGELSRIVAKGLAGKDKLPANEHLRFSSYLYHVFVHLELGFRKWHKGDLDSATWSSWDEGSQWWFSCPGAQKWWANNLAGGFTHEFRNYVDSSIATVNSSDDNYMEQLSDYLAKASETP